jgi:hypothetical protein
MDERTQARYETGKHEGYISAMGTFERGYETEEIFHEEDPLRVVKRLEAEGWMKHLFPALTSSKANAAELERLRDTQGQLQIQGINPDASAANFPLLTAKLAPKDVTSVKKSFPRRGFVAEIESLEKEGKEFAARIAGKEGATPSLAWKLLYASRPEPVLWAAHYSKNTAVQGKFKGFYTEWSQARMKLPYALMQEMRIVPDLPGYDELLDKLFFELMDNKLGTVEEMKAYLEPYSPPAPPPPVHLRRPRAAKKDAKPAKSRKKAVAADTAVPEGQEGAAASTGQPTVPVAGKPAKGGAAASAKPLEKKAAAKVPSVPAAKKATAPVKAKTPLKKEVAKKTVAKKPEARAAMKKKPIAAKRPAKKAAAKKAPAKVAAKKAPAKKAVPVKKSAPAKKAAAKKRH